MVTDQRSDDELVRRAASGDVAALRELYVRYFPHVYDYAIRISRDREIAALVVQAGFLRAFQAILAGEALPSFRLALFASARHDLAERVRRRRGAVTEGEDAFAVVAPGGNAGDAGADLAELARLVWQTARELRIDDYELLDLSVRRGFGPEELAVVLRGRPQAVEQRLAQVQRDFEGAFSSLILYAYGRHACLDLDFMVSEGQWSPTLRKRIVQHMSTCQTCQGTRRRFPPGAELFAMLAFVPAPPNWQQIMLNRLMEAVLPAGAAAAAIAPIPQATPAAPAAAAVITPASAPAPAPAPAPTTAPQPIAPAPQVAYPYASQPAPLPADGGGAGRFFSDGPPNGALLAVLGGGLLILAIIFGSLCATGAFTGGGSKSTPTATMTATSSPTPTLTRTPTPTQTSTPLPPTATPVPPTNTAVPTNTPVLPTNTPPPAPTNTPEP